MSDLFLKVVNMSISTSWLVLAVLLLRFFMKKAPKWANVLLWAIVALRLVCPFSIESGFSLIPSAETIPPQIMADHYPQISTGIQELNDVVNPIISEAFAPNVGDSANPLQILIPIASILWLLGIALLLVYTALTYWRLRRRVDTAVILRDNIFQSEYVDSPFVLGLLKPKIYLPYALGEDSLNYVVAHEEAHICRRDHWWKPLGFLLLTLHWFNPLLWVAYVLLCRDIEMACDEKVIKELGNEERADYTQALVSCSINRRMIAACPLAFGEVGVKARVKSVMNYRKPTFWVILMAVILCAAVAVCFLTNPREGEQVGISYYYGTVTDQAMSVVNEGDLEGREYISFRSDDGEELLIWVAKSCKIPEGLLGKHVMVCTKKEKDTGLLVTTNVIVTDNIWANTPEAAIENAILDHNAWSRREEGWLQCADFVTLANEVGGSAGTNEIKIVTYYGLALHQVFAVENGELVEHGGSHVPTALTFLLDEQGRYILNEYWEPRDGVYNASDIKEKFPAFVWPDTQEHIHRQVQNNYAKAVEHFQLDTTPIINDLLEKSVEKDEIAYRELLYYGQYTLRYCFTQFEKGGRTDEWARIMSKACKEIIEIWGESVPGAELSGQAWFDLYEDHAQSVLAKKNPEKVLAEKPSVAVYSQVKGIPLYDWGVSLSAENVSPAGLTIVCTQSGGNFASKEGPFLSSINLITGSVFLIEKHMDGEWISLPVPESLTWTTIAYPISINDTTQWTVEWSEIYGTLEPGHYRIGKPVSFSPAPGDTSSQMYYAEFTIE